MIRLYHLLCGACMMLMATLCSAVQPDDRVIYFAGGCFWGVEEYFSRIPGVIDVAVGYTNGKTEDPSYEDICSQKTGHAETARVVYAPHIVSLRILARQFFKIIDPVSVGRQGHDAGSQYRTGMYYASDDDKPVLESVLDEERKKHRQTWHRGSG